MKTYRFTYAITLFLGDFCVWFSALWLALLLRRLELPSVAFYFEHAIPYTLVFIVWFLIAYSFGLYDSRMVMLKSKFSSLLLQTQLYSAGAAIALFYIAPSFIVKPRFTLFFILFMTIVGMFAWRLIGVRVLGVRNREKGIYIATGDEAREFFQLVNDASYYPLVFAHYCDANVLSGKQLVEWVNSFVTMSNARVVVLDPQNEKIKPILPELYALAFDGVHFVDANVIYEDLTEKIRLSRVNHTWLIENISRRGHVGYDALKRLMDLVVAVPLFILSVPFYIPIIFAIRLDGGPAFFIQERIGKNNKRIYIAKFRTMTAMDNGVFVHGVDNRITKVGKFLRATRLDEFPQLVSVIVGDLSLIGPRPEASGLLDEFNKQIPYFSIRHFITPGLSGWAQVHHEKPPRTIEETAEKLAYDLYYIKHRSFLLDVKISLKTLYTLVSKAGM